MSLVYEEIKLTSDAIRYGFAVGKIRVLETRAVDASALERLLDAPTFAEQKRLLSDTPYGRFLEDADTPEAVEGALDEVIDSLFRFLKEAELPADVPAFFRLQYDHNNLRAAAKAQLLGAPLAGLLSDHGSVPVESFEGPLDSLPGELGRLARGFAARQDTDVPRHELLIEIDEAVDAAMFAQMLTLAERSRSRFLVDFTRLRIDLANVRVLVRGAVARVGAERVRGSLITGGAIPLRALSQLAGSPVDQVVSTLRARSELSGLPDTDLGNPSVLDVALDSIAIRALQRGRRGPIGPEPVIAYVLSRQVEVAVIRVLLLGQLAGIDPEVLRERVNAVRG